MANTFHFYRSGLSGLASDINWTSDTIKVSLHTSSYTPNQDTHTTMADVTNEVGASGTYAAGGATLGTKSIDVATTKVARLIAADVAFTNATITARVAVIYKYVDATASNNKLIGYCIFGDASPADVVSTAGTFTLDFDQTNGIFTLTAS